MTGTWLTTPDEEIVPRLQDLLDLLTARAVNDEPGFAPSDDEASALDSACVHLAHAINRVKDAQRHRKTAEKLDALAKEPIRDTQPSAPSAGRSKEVS